MHIGQQRVVHLIGDSEDEDHMAIVRRGPATGRGRRRGPPPASSTGRAGHTSVQMRTFA
jgi:hypothetical protein